jgi:hypothetical protein
MGDLGADASGGGGGVQRTWLANCSDAAKVAASGRVVQVEEASAFTVNVMPTMETLRASGVQDLRCLAAALDNRRVRPAREAAMASRT